MAAYFMNCFLQFIPKNMRVSDNLDIKGPRIFMKLKIFISVILFNALF